MAWGGGPGDHPRTRQSFGLLPCWGPAKNPALPDAYPTLNTLTIAHKRALVRYLVNTASVRVGGISPISGHPIGLPNSAPHPALYGATDSVACVRFDWPNSASDYHDMVSASDKRPIFWSYIYRGTFLNDRHTQVGYAIQTPSLYAIIK